jgi:hypothetical protein
MPYLIGVIVALLTGGLLGRLVGFGGDRAFYPTVLIITASYYVLFAAMGGSHRAVHVELLLSCLFVALAVAGFKRYPWLVVVGLVGHGAFDLVHGRLQLTSALPEWWPAFCLAFDVAIAPFVALPLIRRRAGS